ncbi:hypothetical protein ABDK75_10495 [Gluconobacter sp. OJA]|uniref:hypothetical protein n=1 Tax=Gluconobacter sp. OJA TaxID=3145197 RepID=UPI0031FA2A77
MSTRYRRRPETPAEIRAEHVDFWTRAAERYERTAHHVRMPGMKIWAAAGARSARASEAKRKREQACATIPTIT